MVNIIKDEQNVKRYTSMDLKKLLTVIGAVGSILVALFTWGNSVSESNAKQDVAISNIAKSVEELKGDYKILQSQNSEINTKLTDMLHKQDKRLSLLEFVITSGQVSKESEE